MAIYVTSKMELLSRAYIDALAASVNSQISNTKIDHQSIDGTFESSKVNFPKIDFQLKSTHSYDFDSSGKFSFPLPVKNYHDLRADRIVPIILIVLVMPPLEAEWLGHDHDALFIKKCAYWKSLANAPDIPNTETKNVTIEKNACFSPKVLDELLEKAGRREAL